MKSRLFCFFVTALFVECIFAQEHIQVKAESAINSYGQKHFVFTFTNTSEKDIRIWVSAYHPSSSKFSISFLDDNGQVVCKGEGDIFNDLEKDTNVKLN